MGTHGVAARCTPGHASPPPKEKKLQRLLLFRCCVHLKPHSSFCQARLSPCIPGIENSWKLV